MKKLEARVARLEGQRSVDGEWIDVSIEQHMHTFDLLNGCLAGRKSEPENEEERRIWRAEYQPRRKVQRLSPESEAMLARIRLTFRP